MSFSLSSLASQVSLSASSSNPLISPARADQSLTPRATPHKWHFSPEWQPTEPASDYCLCFGHTPRAFPFSMHSSFVRARKHAEISLLEC